MNTLNYIWEEAEGCGALKACDDSSYLFSVFVY